MILFWIGYCSMSLHSNMCASWGGAIILGPKALMGSPISSHLWLDCIHQISALLLVPLIFYIYSGIRSKLVYHLLCSMSECLVMRYEQVKSILIYTVIRMLIKLEVSNQKTTMLHSFTRGFHVLCSVSLQKMDYWLLVNKVKWMIDLGMFFVLWFHFVYISG